VFFVQNEKLAFWREKRKKKVIPKNTIIEALGCQRKKLSQKLAFPFSDDWNHQGVVRDAEEVVVRFLSAERSVSGVQRVLKTHHDR
jgi:hypothetical protein